MTDPHAEYALLDDFTLYGKEIQKSWFKYTKKQKYRKVQTGRKTTKQLAKAIFRNGKVENIQAVCSIR